ncbi:MAG: diacylglycerol kinase [Neisseriaceae bacterium]|nr:MAG: diacylglycerol kinase [Neisseriaceae bacterium]
MRHKFLGTGEPGYHPWKKIKTVFSGLRYAIIYDWSVTWKLLLSAVVLGLAYMFREWIDVLLILLATAFVLVSEIFNSAIEAMCDFVETHENPKIKVIKDMAAAAVGIAMLAWLAVIATDAAEVLRVFSAGRH